MDAKAPRGSSWARRLGAAEVPGYPRVAHQPLQQRQVAAAPWLEGHCGGINFTPFIKEAERRIKAVKA